MKKFYYVLLLSFEIIILVLAIGCGSDDSVKYSGAGDEETNENDMVDDEEYDSISGDIEEEDLSNSCNPNPCIESNKTVCTIIGNGNYTCSCNNGYEDYGDGTCKYSDPCSLSNPCQAVNRACENNAGEVLCGDCLSGYHETVGACLEDIYCSENTCSGNGVCEDSSGEPICICDDGYKGDYCEDCDDLNGWHWNTDGDTCTLDPCDPNPCNTAENRICEPATGNCICDQYFCEINGVCYSNSTPNPDNLCEKCNFYENTTGWSSSDGTFCNDGLYCTINDTCDSGSCIGTPRDCNDLIFCNGTESCNEIDDVCEHSGNPCLDDSNFCNGDESCNEYSESCDHSGDPCLGNGICRNNICHCNQGYKGIYCNQCDDGYLGYPSCVDDPCDPDPCSGNGTCYNGNCSCNGGYSGSNCNECASGFINYPNCVDDPCDPDPCSGNGYCLDDGNCDCNQGFTGIHCNSCADGFIGYPNCVDNPCYPDPCNGHGVCNESNGSCICDNQNMTVNCSACKNGFINYPDCVDDPCEPDPCLGHGYCQDDGSCDCYDGYIGYSCDDCDFGFIDYPSCQCPDGFTAYFSQCVPDFLYGGMGGQLDCQNERYEIVHPIKNDITPSCDFECHDDRVGGIDYPGNIGDPVYSTVFGTVIEVNNGFEGRPIDPITSDKCTIFQSGNYTGWSCNKSDGFGNSILLKDRLNRLWVFGHFKNNGINVVRYQVVQAGQYLGEMGNSGWTISSNGDGTHVHVGVKSGGDWKDFAPCINSFGGGSDILSCFDYDEDTYGVGEDCDSQDCNDNESNYQSWNQNNDGCLGDESDGYSCSDRDGDNYYSGANCPWPDEDCNDLDSSIYFGCTGCSSGECQSSCEYDSDCDPNKFCSSESCIDDICPQGEYYCSGNQRRLCSSNGAYFSFIYDCEFNCIDGVCQDECESDSSCDSDEFCSSGSCVDDICLQGEYYCDGELYSTLQQ